MSEWVGGFNKEFGYSFLHFCIRIESKLRNFVFLFLSTEFLL